MLPSTRPKAHRTLALASLSLWLPLVVMSAEAPTSAKSLSAATQAARQELNTRYPDEAVRVERGIGQVLRYWREDDGGAPELQQFLVNEFVPRGPAQDATLARFEFALERLGGYMNSLGRDLRSGVDLDRGPQLALDGRLAAWEPASHLADDLFKHKLAFVALLNFPLTTLAERVRDGQGWSRRQWAETRLAGQFTTRVPADVQARIATALADAESYINGYNIFMHHVLTRDGRRLFKPGLRLISHWNLRDELKAAYADGEGVHSRREPPEGLGAQPRSGASPQGPSDGIHSRREPPEALERQRLIALVMDKIVRQEIPRAAIDNPLLDWTPETGAIVASSVRDAEAPAGALAVPDATREPDTRYARWKAIFDAQRQADAYAPDNPTYVERRFNVEREIPEPEVRALFEGVLSSPLGARVGHLVAQRLGRPLEPHDIWYAGFKPRAAHAEAELDALTRARYPTPEAYAADMPRLLADLGFTPERAGFLSQHIAVDPSRGAGHALGARRRDDQAHLRTRVGPGGMDYKGYNIAVHEMGHTVEQVFSVTTIDHTLLMGVPNNAFTEALAFVFQARDLELLGLGQRDQSQRQLRTLETFWSAREIAGVALVDMDAWHWLYAHPEATPAEFRAALVTIAQDVWNRHFATIFGRRDATLLGIYSHMVNYGLYTPDYPLGYLIAFQVEAHFDTLAGPMGPEFERICQLGSITPDAWMRQAVGAPLSAQPLLAAAEGALAAVGQAAAKPRSMP